MKNPKDICNNKMQKALSRRYSDSYFTKIWLSFLQFICKKIGHGSSGINFHTNGRYWCFSAGPYDSMCHRCGLSWEEFDHRGKEALDEMRKDDAKPWRKDPRKWYPQTGP